jgi:TRAP-type C4-dicarboxylate transport system permease small subunit
LSVFKSFRVAPGWDCVEPASQPALLTIWKNDVAKVIDFYCRFLKLCIAACLAVMVVLVFGNVVLRYGFNSGITISEELSRWLLVWLTFLGAVVALRDHGHLGVDSLVRVLPRVGKRICFILSYLLMLYADWLLLAGSWTQMLITSTDRAPATNLSVGFFFYGAGVVFGVSAAVIIAYDLWRVLSGVATEDEMVAVAESEEMPPPSAVQKPQ